MREEEPPYGPSPEEGQSQGYPQSPEQKEQPQSYGFSYRLPGRAEGEEENEGEGETAFRIETILNIATAQPGPPSDELIDALTDYLMEHEDIDGVEILPPMSAAGRPR